MPQSQLPAIYILGGAQTDFAQNTTRSGLDIGQLMAEPIYKSAQENQISLSDVDSVHIGNFNGELFCQQGILGGLVAQYVPELYGKAISRHEAACASGSMALRAAIADLAAGFSQVSCAVGVELMRNVSGLEAGKHLGTAAFAGHEALDAEYVWPHMFHRLSDEYEKRYGLNYSHLAAIAENNFNNAKSNPYSQTRQWQFEDNAFSVDDEANPVVEGWVRRNDCSQITDGAANVILATKEYATQYCQTHGLSLESLPQIKGFASQTAAISYDTKLEHSKDNEYVFPHVRDTLLAACNQANLSIEQLDALECHDCFAITEYMIIDHLGFHEPGEAWRFIEEGNHKIGGKLPINPSGGLIGVGHPVGASGIRMVLDAYRQVKGLAELNQVKEAKNVATLNIGGSTTTVASAIVGY